MMENLFNPGIRCTDPDNLQFCLKISDGEFWYCEPNIYHESIYTDGTPENRLYERYKGNPKQFLIDTRTDENVKQFVNNRHLWLSGSIDADDFTHEEKTELLSGYGYAWDSFSDDSERNQIICENYFEQNPMDFHNDI
jgi:hypothetical protein